ncbi:MAG: hypothetical protein AAF517_24630 [Planctomycetota bacterium]
MVVSLAILTVTMLPVGYATLKSSSAFSSLVKRSDLVSRAPVIVDRLVEEISGGRLISPASPSNSSSVRFDHVTSVSAGAPVYGAPIQIDFVSTENAGSDSLDNDGDGITDEGGIRIWEDRDPTGATPGNEDVVVVIAENLASNGLLFTRLGNTLLISATFEAVAERGKTSETFTIHSAAPITD